MSEVVALPPAPISQREYRDLFEQLMSRGKRSPFFGKEEFALFAVEAIGMEIEQLRLARDDDISPPVSIKEKFAEHLATYPTQAGRDDAHFRLKSMLGYPTARGRPKTAEKRWPLIQQIYFVYPAGSVKLTQSSRPARGGGVDRASHFEATVRVALNIAGNHIRDVHAECLAALSALRDK